MAATCRGLGDRIVLDLGAPPAILDQFRASGRFFWPVGYALLIGTMVLIARRWRLGSALVLVLGITQWVDAAPNRAALTQWASKRLEWSVDADALRPAIAAARQVTILPTWVCIPSSGHATRERVQELLLLTSERAVPVNTMQVARWRTEPVCTDRATALTPLGDGELRLVMPEARSLLGSAPECRPLGGLIACFHPGDRGRPAGEMSLDEVKRAALRLVKHASQILADDAERDELHPAEEQHHRHQTWIAGHGVTEDQGPDHNDCTVDDRDCCGEQAEIGRDLERCDREARDPL